LKREVSDSLELRITNSENQLVRTIAIPDDRNAYGIQTVCWDTRVQPVAPPDTGGAGAGAARGGGRGGGRGRGPSPVPGVPSPMPVSGVDPQNPCAGMGGSGSAGPRVLPGTYNVALAVGGNVVDTKPITVVLDPIFQMTASQQRQYFETVSELHEAQRRGTSAAEALHGFYTQMTDLGEKVPGMSNVPDDVKTQFEAVKTELDGVREKFGVPLSAGGGGRGRGRGFGGGGGGNSANVLGRLTTVKNAIMAFYAPPSDNLSQRAEQALDDLPDAIDEANSLFGTAAGLARALAEHDVTLTVPAQVR
jgi:hypothetical protein